MRGPGSICALTCLLLLGLLPASAAAAEGETHTFNATLSLSGGCSESELSTLDPVPDPGCPANHPPKPFARNGGVAVDRYGNRYVASTSEKGPGGRIDVFSSAGQFITETPEAMLPGFKASLAVDSQGYLYVGREEGLLRYKPTKYNPAAGKIEYGEPPVTVPNPLSTGGWGEAYIPLAISPANDHLFVREVGIVELSSAAEGNDYVKTISFEGIIESARFVNSFAVDAARKRIYVADLDAAPFSGGKPVIKAFDLEAPGDPEKPRELLFTIDGSTTPTKRFVSETWSLALAVDEATGHVFVGDLNASTRRVYEFDADGTPVSTVGEGILTKSSGAAQLQLAYDDSPTSPTQGYLFVPSHSGPGRSLAFGPPPVTGPPVVEGLSVSGVTTADAILQGKVNPEGVETAYRIEYTTEQEFQANGGFQGAVLAGQGTVKPSSEAIAVSAPAAGLQPGTAYRFRILADSSEGQDEDEASFNTFAPVEVSTDCPNQALRPGPSALLPDCRAYELVTPADTNGHPPLGPGRAGGIFTDRQVSPAGDKLPFRLEGAPLSSFEGTGSLNGDPYLATRTASGWSTAYEGPSAAFAPDISPGTSSPDQGYSFWLATGFKGSALLGGDTGYVRYPDGHSELLGQGSLAVDGNALGVFISEGGNHIVFSTGVLSRPIVQLEPAAAPNGTGALYDRTADGILHVVSLKPGDVPFGAGDPAFYRGASPDGKGIAFEVKGTLYLRYDNEATFEIGKGADFAGVAEGGDRVFYVEGGDHNGEGKYLGGGNLKAFDLEAGPIDFTTTSDATPVTVSPDGSVAYFTSPSVLGEANPEGDVAQPDAQNLYRSVEGQIGFVATVTERDVLGALAPDSNEMVDGLGLWLSANVAAAPGRLAVVPARSTADGGVLLFKSRAALSGYDPEGHAEIYRYDFAAGELDCLSCNPTGAAASSDATLQLVRDGNSREFFELNVWLANLSADGRRAFFETGEGLVATDTDGLTDVYEWEEEGVGGCAKPDGCLYLISSGQSGRDEHLWAVSESGDDVFFISSDLLGGGDVDETPSIYDARVDGGFPPPPSPPGECLGEACQPAAVAPNDPPTALQGAGNVKGKKTIRGQRACPKGKRMVRSSGRRCVSRHVKKHRNAKKQAKGNPRAGR